MSIDPSKLSFCSLNTYCYITGITFFIIISSKQHNPCSCIQLPTLIEKNPMEKYKSMLETEKIDWDSFQFKAEAFNETKVNIINDLFNVISDSDLSFFASNI